MDTINKIGIHKIFPVSIYTNFIDSKVADYIEKISIKKLDKLELNISVYSDYAKKEKILKVEEIGDLIIELDKHIEEYSNKSGIAVGNQVDHWVQDYRRGNRHNIHAHPNSSISGVYFIRANEHSGTLRFNNPNPYPYFQKPNIQKNYVEWTECDIKPQKGLLVLFPSYLFHEVLPSEHSNVIRTSLAFNVSIPNTDHIIPQ